MNIVARKAGAQSRRLQVARPKSFFVEVSSGTCESAGHVTIEDGPECKQAAELWGYQITWGPNGGFKDVVDGCSIRGKTDAFLIKPAGCIKGAPTPEWVPGANGKATCTCTEWQPCMCRASTSSGWGSIFLLMFLLVTSAYVGSGLAFGWKQGRKPLGQAGPKGLLAIHPHFSQWSSMSGLVSDGLAFTLSRGARNGTRRDGYSSLGAQAVKPISSVKQPKKSTKSKKSKSSSTHKTASDTSDERSVIDTTLNVGAVATEGPMGCASTPASASAARGTVAGDVSSLLQIATRAKLMIAQLTILVVCVSQGGRWVHVPN